METEPQQSEPERKSSVHVGQSKRSYKELCERALYARILDAKTNDPRDVARLIKKDPQLSNAEKIEFALRLGFNMGLQFEKRKEEPPVIATEEHHGTTTAPGATE